MKSLTITQRITLLWIALFATGIAFFALIAAISVYRATQGALDAQLAAQTIMAANIIDGQTGNLEVEELPSRLAGFAMVLLRDGHVVDVRGTRPLTEAIALASQVRFNAPTTILTDPAYRVLVHHVPQWPNERLIAFAYEGHVTETLDHLRRSFLWTFIPAMLLCGFAAWTLARRSLAPVDRMARTALRIAQTAEIGERFNVAGDDELGRLAAAFNVMLERIQAVFERERAFIGDISHELRQPLFAIKGETELMLQRDRDEKTYRDAFERIGRRAADLAEAADGLLLLARADAGALTPSGESEINEALTEVCSETQRLHPQVSIQLKLTPEHWLVPVNGALLRRLFGNIVRNAAVATTSLVEVRVESDSAGRVVVHVCDDGAGVDPRERERIFRRFYRSNDAGGGTGLGLAIASAIAQLARARIEVKDRPGGGAQFDIIFESVSSN